MPDDPHQVGGPNTGSRLAFVSRCSKEPLGDRRENPYAAPQTAPEPPTETSTPSRKRRFVWTAIEFVVAIAVALAILWLVNVGRRP